VWIPCCTSDIVFPLLFAKGRGSRMPHQIRHILSDSSLGQEENLHEDSHS
jgi:hypothetical protein